MYVCLILDRSFRIVKDGLTLAMSQPEYYAVFEEAARRLRNYQKEETVPKGNNLATQDTSYSLSYAGSLINQLSAVDAAIQASTAVYKDSDIHVEAIVNKNGVTFKLKNVSQNSIRIIWDECAIVTPDKKTHKTVHNSSTYLDRNRPQVSSVVPPNAVLEIKLFPLDNWDWNGDDLEISPLLSPAPRWRYGNFNVCFLRQESSWAQT